MAFSFFNSFKSIFSRTRPLDEIIPELEELLIAADVGPAVTDRLLTKLSQNKKASTIDEAVVILKQEMIEILTGPSIKNQDDTRGKPSVIYFVGVNGTGKTTTIGKMAHFFKNGKTFSQRLIRLRRTTLEHLNASTRVLCIAADTFRAAAIDQLKVWADRVGADFVGGRPEADPSSVIVDGLRSAKAKNVDVILVDTAGRLQTKQNLMSELQKMVRMTERELGKKPDEIFLVLDAVTGQNGLMQARVFLEAIPLTGIILTKYDATAKGGIVFSVVEETKLPIRFIGEGEGVGDLREFDANGFVERMFE